MTTAKVEGSKRTGEALRKLGLSIWRKTGEETHVTHVEMIRKLGLHFFGHGPRTIFGVVALVPAYPRRTQINL